MAEIGRDLCRHLGHPLLKQGHLQHSAQGHIQAAVGDLQGCHLHHLSELRY